MRRPGTRGFTLIELLVVVAIIGIMTAMLLPAVQKARLSALRVSCASNMRQTLVALLCYAGRYHEFPPNVDPAVALVQYNFEGLGWGAPAWQGLEGTPSHWRGYLVAYNFGNPKVLGCASTLRDGYSWRGYSTNWFETDINRMRLAPPFYYLGPGVDCYRGATYYTGLNATRPGRSYKARARGPIITDPYYESTGAFSGHPYGSTLVSHTYQYCNPREGEPWWYPNSTYPNPRIYDMNVGWSDGSVELCTGKFYTNGFKKLFDYDWNIRQPKWGFY